MGLMGAAGGPAMDAAGMSRCVRVCRLSRFQGRDTRALGFMGRRGRGGEGRWVDEALLGACMPRRVQRHATPHAVLRGASLALGAEGAGRVWGWVQLHGCRLCVLLCS